MPTPSTHPVGRPSKFTEETKAKLFEAIRLGAPYEIACNYARVSYSLFREWIIRAEQGKDPKFMEFLDELKAAEGETSLRWLKKIDEAMDEGVWQTAAWKLERRRYKYFSSRAEVLDLAEQVKNLADKLQGNKNGEVDSKEEKQDSEE